MREGAVCGQLYLVGSILIRMAVVSGRQVHGAGECINTNILHTRSQFCSFLFYYFNHVYKINLKSSYIYLDTS